MRSIVMMALTVGVGGVQDVSSSSGGFRKGQSLAGAHSENFWVATPTQVITTIDNIPYYTIYVTTDW